MYNFQKLQETENRDLKKKINTLQNQVEKLRMAPAEKPLENDAKVTLDSEYGYSSTCKSIILLAICFKLESLFI